MSTGTICLTCRAYIGSKEWHCRCANPVPSEDGKTPIPPSVSVRVDDLRRWESWFQIQVVAHTGELSAKARSIRDDMQRYLTAK